MRLPDISFFVRHRATDSASVSRRVEPSREDFSRKTCGGLYTGPRVCNPLLTPCASRFPNTPATTWQTNSGAPTDRSIAKQASSATSVMPVMKSAAKTLRTWASAGSHWGRVVCSTLTCIPKIRQALNFKPLPKLYPAPSSPGSHQPQSTPVRASCAWLHPPRGSWANLAGDFENPVNIPTILDLHVNFKRKRIRKPH